MRASQLAARCAIALVISPLARVSNWLGAFGARWADAELRHLFSRPEPEATQTPWRARLLQTADPREPSDTACPALPPREGQS